jgi:hypothetical protein
VLNWLFVFFGRSIIYKDQGQILLRLATDLEEFGKVEAMPVLEGEMIMFIAPKKGKIRNTIQKKGKSKNKTSCKNTEINFHDKETV